MSNSTFPRKWTTEFTKTLLSAPNFIVFSYLDFLDSVFCVIYKYLDVFFEGKASPCYCTTTKISENGSNGKMGGNEEIGMSETLHGRKKKLKELIVLIQFVEKLLNKKKGVEGDYRFRNQKKAAVHRLGNRWSDCGCDSCISWMKTDDPKLHVVVKEASSQEDSKGNPNPSENVIFIHGILSSSSFWTKTLFPQLSESKKSNGYNMFAFDLLGCGKSPKPRDNLYTLNDHVEWIEKSVISRFQLNSFHLVAHSMGCIIALALAAKHSKSVKSVTLVAPPYFPSKDGVEFTVINSLTPKKLWPPEAFLSSVMTWYEHLGRCVCLLMCRNHTTWERLIKRLTGVRDLNFMFLDLTKHTHHSGWHTTHNVLYRGVKQMDRNLEILMKSKKKVHVFMGTRDRSVPPDCGDKMKKKFPDVEVNNIPNAGHRSVIFRREKDFAHDLLQIWENAAADHHDLHEV
ncbi:probable lysophospholipase BODYGUARD 4 [Durio zibethinus]|uniref:Probable lysophospholipase BODYGUARD 4 n=1 Tax=Durio zibethinus TaxID=66656 RepID=A0A6P5YTJ0_DURZI|nr:probable lysophospholipase BODYGUARD 4 [Durio zibethinus]